MSNCFQVSSAVPEQGGLDETSPATSTPEATLDSANPAAAAAVLNDTVANAATMTVSTASVLQESTGTLPAAGAPESTAAADPVDSAANAATMPASTVSVLQGITDTVFALCPELTFGSPWEFVRAHRSCRACAGDTRAALDALMARYPLADLVRANIVERTDGDIRLRSALRDPHGVIVTLQRTGADRPHELLTAQGYLAGEELILSPMLTDGATAVGVKKLGLLFLSFDIKELAWLRSLDLPAALCPRFDRLTVDQLRAFNERFSESCWSPFSQERRDILPSCDEPHPEDAAARNDSGKAQGSAPMQEAAAAPRPEAPLLALVGWSPLSLSDQQCPHLDRTLDYFAKIQRHLHLALDGIAVWRPGAATLEKLNFVLRWQSVALVRETLLEELNYDLRHWSGLAAQQANRTPESFTSARAELLQALEENSPPYNFSYIQQRYDRIIRQDLIAPLVSWAVENSDPVIQNVGTELVPGFASRSV